MISRTIETEISVDNLTSLIQAEAENRLREVGLILPSDNVMAIEFGGGPIPVKITLETKEVFIKTNYG